MTPTKREKGGHDGVADRSDRKPDDVNLILGQSHFVKTVYEALCPRFRLLVTVMEHDVRDPPPDGPFDLILCRNLSFTYFGIVLQREVARNPARPSGKAAHSSLAPTRLSRE